MTVMKAVVRGILIASLASTSARAGSIRYLGVNSGDAMASPVAFSPPSSPNLTGPIAPVPGLRLALYGGPGPTPFIPTTATAPMLPPSSPPPAVVPASVGILAQAPSAQAPSAPSAKFDAFINLGSGPYPNSGTLTTGNPQPWYVGASVDRLFGGVPTIPQAAAFDATVLRRVQQTFNLSGLNVTLTSDANAPAAHTISVVSQSNNPSLAGALGMTYLGGNGFQYIDTAANSATSVDQLEWIVAHNLAHELMLAFGVPEIHDQSGRFIDAPDASWSMMTSSSSTFSTGAVADLLSKNYLATGASALVPSAQLLGPSTAPEPSTVLLWAAIGSAGALTGSTRRRAQNPPTDRKPGRIVLRSAPGHFTEHANLSQTLMTL